MQPLLKRRLGVVFACAGIVAVAALLLTRSHAQATNSIKSFHPNKIQRRIMSQTLASYLAATTTAKSAPTNDGGGGPDGAPFTPPASFGPMGGGSGSLSGFQPGSNGKCSSVRGTNVKVNQNCLNVTDPDLQGRAQANNETSIAQDPFSPNHIVASDNNYVRGDGTCGAHFSLDGGQTWSDSTVPNGFTRGPAGFAREYWQASGDTSVGWDTQGNAYLSCQVFNRGTVASPNPDQSSAFVVFRSTQNNGASWNFPGRYTTVNFDVAGAGTVLEDKALMTVDNNPGSKFRDRIYVTWTEFAADGSSYIYEVHSNDFGETFSSRVLVSENSPLCTNTFGAGTPNGNCNENQYSQPFVGPDGNLYVAYSNFNNQPTSGSDNRFQVLLSKSIDGGVSFSAPVKVSDYYDLPDCNTYQGAGADSFRDCVPEKGASTISVFRATQYPSGAVNPRDPNEIAVTFGSYINKDSNEANGCAPAGFAADGDPTYTGVKTAGACNNKILVSVSKDGGSTFTGTSADPRVETVVPQDKRQSRTDQYFQWAAFTHAGRFAVSYYDRAYGADEFNGSSDISLSGSSNLVDFGSTRVTTSSMPAPTQFEGPKGGQFYGDYAGMSVAGSRAHPVWSDTRFPDVFVCPGTAVSGAPPALCGGTEANGEAANDEEIVTASVPVPSGH